MPAYNFMPEFAGPVRSGAKPQTIRRKRKRPTVPGDTLILRTGMRTPGPSELLMRVPCAAVTPITIEWSGITLHGEALRYYAGRFGNCERESFIRRDGFGMGIPAETAFASFFSGHYGLPTEGLELIEWRPEEALEEAPDES